MTEDKKIFPMLAWTRVTSFIENKKSLNANCVRAQSGGDEEIWTLAPAKPTYRISNVLCDMESVRKEQKIMQEKLLYLQVKSELKAAKSGKKPWVRIGFKNGSKKAKKRELGENGENSGENKTPFPTYFSGTLKILLERTFTPFFCCWPKSAKRCKWWLQKNIATRFCSNTPNT